MCCGATACPATMFGGQLSNPNPVVFDVPSDATRTSSSGYRGDVLQPDEIFGMLRRRICRVNAATPLTKPLVLYSVREDLQTTFVTSR